MAQAKIVAEPDEIVDGKTDDRGRIYLGSEHADQNVKVAIIDTDVETSS